jgi:DNA-binding HxlR family transcriptional regulator
VTSTRSYGDPCGVARSLDLLGERWSLLVIRDLLLGPKRFNDLLDGLVGISPNVLSQRLRELSDHGVVRRRDLGPPTRVRVYELTDWGRELEPVLLGLARWGALAPRPAARDLGLDSMILGLKATFDPARPPGPPATYEVRVGDDSFTLEIGDSSLDIRRGTEAEPAATLSTDRATLLAVLTGRRTVAAALASGELRMTGSRQATRRLARLLRTPPAPGPDK